MRRVMLAIILTVMLGSTMVRVSAYSPNGCEGYTDWYEPSGAEQTVDSGAYVIAYTTRSAEWHTANGADIEVCIETTDSVESVWWFFTDGSIEMKRNTRITRIGVTAKYTVFLPLIIN